ncbi:unnamed protein product [Candida verbasci]|uniref:Uncharacterized protein n=1 Tax=Candida verbasci TaxID=1227364 RepID=A0A9W4TYV6_9ASCO|nr:unnamed protein product [Candida verbasci]
MLNKPFKPPRLIKTKEIEKEEKEEKVLFESKVLSVQWRKKTNKKNKTWDGDGTIQINNHEIILKSEENKTITRKTYNKLPSFDDVISIGNYEIEVESEITEPIQKKTKLVGKKTKVVPLVYDSPNAIKLSDSISIDPILSQKLRSHQVEGVKFLYQSLESYSGCLLADEMGLGKTLTAITTIYTLYKQADYKKFLIVCPVTLINNWKAEFKKWINNKLSIQSSAEKSDIVNFGRYNVYQILIINYEKLSTCFQELSNVKFDLLVCDEGHRLKNKDSKVLQNLTSLNIPKRIILTGTPIQNELLEFYTLVNFLNPGVLPDLKTFQKKFVCPITRSRDLHCIDRSPGEEATQELVNLTSQFILRRTGTAGLNLTKKTDILLFVPPTTQQIELLKSAEFEHSFQLINTFKKICNSPYLHDNSLPKASGKINILIPLLIECIANKEKIVLISNYTSTLTLLEEIIKKLNFTFLRLDGSTPNNIRNKLVSQFNNSSINIFLLSSKSGGMGINLIGASRLILFDNDWNPSVDLQSISRIHRDGQLKPCFIYRLFTSGCIDEKIFQRQLLKLKLSSRFLGNDSDGINDFDHEDLKNLFNVENTICNTHDLICDCAGTGEKVEVENEADEEDEEEKENVKDWISAKDIKDDNVKKRAVKLALNDYQHFKPECFNHDEVLEKVLKKIKVSFVMSKVS